MTDRNYAASTKAWSSQAGTPVSADGWHEGARGAAAVCQEGPAKDERAGQQAREVDRQVAAQPVQLEAVPDGVDGGADRQQDGSPGPHLPLLHPHQPCQPPGIRRKLKLPTVFLSDFGQYGRSVDNHHKKILLRSIVINTDDHVVILGH